MIECSYTDCIKGNYLTALLTVDTYGTRWFCDEHWTVMGLLFNNIVLKCSGVYSCRRNHHAEVGKKGLCLTTVKFEGKFFDLCDKHNDIYEELIGINSLFSMD